MARKLKRKTEAKKAIRRDEFKKNLEVGRKKKKRKKSVHKMCMSAVQRTELTSVRQVDKGTGLVART